MPRFDLHSHSTVSDGLLTPAQVTARAASRGVDVYALTDHDEIGGLAEAAATALDTGMRFVCGAELSTSWEDVTLHIVGLGIDPENHALTEGLATIRSGRNTRARRIAASLEAAGIPGAYEGALRYVTSEQLISRTHFARFLVDAGRAKDVKEVFKRYLVAGTPGYAAHQWASLKQSIDWIHGAGGQAVLAHPGRYKITRSDMRRLLSEFRELGGEGIEVLSPSHTPAQYAEYAGYARVYGLLASCGSDYHGPGESWMDLGDLPDLPGGVVPIWKDW